MQGNEKEQSFNSNFFEMKLSLTSVYTQQKSYQTSNQLKQFSNSIQIQTISNINILTISLTLCHTRRQIYQLVWDADP